jgi:hypothetical protein
MKNKQTNKRRRQRDHAQGDDGQQLARRLPVQLCGYEDQPRVRGGALPLGLNQGCLPAVGRRATGGARQASAAI